MSERADQLRRLAEWYRGWAIVGNGSEREWRLGFADHLDRKALDCEQAAPQPQETVSQT